MSATRRWHQVPESKIPSGWSRDWSAHKYDMKWHIGYGGMQWWFNDVLHVPGDPVLLLFELDPGSRFGGDRELIEIDGCFFFNYHFPEDRTASIEEGTTMETILLALTQQCTIKEQPALQKDYKAMDNFFTWLDSECVAHGQRYNSDDDW